MKLRSHSNRAERSPKQRAADVIRVEEEQRLEFNLRGVVDVLKSADYPAGGEHPLRSDYHFLLLLVGQPYLHELFPNNEGDIKSKTQGFADNAMVTDAQLGLAARAKLAGVRDYTQKAHIEAGQGQLLEGAIQFLTVLNERPWSIAVEHLILFPEKRAKILEILEPSVGEHVRYIEQEPINDPEFMDWEELVSLKLLFPEQKEVLALIKRRWSKWTRLLDRLLSEAKRRKNETGKTTKYQAVMGLACAMHILAAEKAVINTEGLPEIIPSSKKLTQPPELPERPLT